MLAYVFDGTAYSTRSQAFAARRSKYRDLLKDGLNSTQAAEAVGVSKRTGKVWRNGRGHAHQPNEPATVAWRVLPAATGPTEQQTQRRQDYHDLLKQGLNSAQAARQVGVGPSTAYTWVNGRKTPNGHIRPPVMDWYRARVPRPAPTNPRYLSEAERLVIADGLTNRDTIRAIARDLGRPPSTVSREIHRHRDAVTGRYNPYQADQQAAIDRRRPKARKVEAINRLGLVVFHQITRLHWSPEQVSAWLTTTFVHNTAMRLSTEAIYQAIYIQPRGELKRQITTAMRQGHTRRKPHKRPDERRPRFRDPMIMISERPPEIEDRAVPGHWEGDLIIGKNSASAIGTLVERASRYLMLVHLPVDHSAQAVRDAIIDKMKTLEPVARKTLTWDQGIEMALHRKISTELDMDIYFCDPHSPWQRGSNENTNGLLRQYFPKGTDLSIHDQARLARVEWELNHRPRKTLNWATPATTLTRLLH